MLLKKAVEKERKIYSSPGSSSVSRKLGEYSGLLASQGCINTALGYLRQDTTDPVQKSNANVHTFNCFIGLCYTELVVSCLLCGICKRF